MWDWLREFFNSDGYMPHVHCYLQQPGLTWTHVISDTLIGLAYVAISLTLVGLVRRGRPDIPFHSMFLAFGLFIIACGGTHFMEVWTTWTPTYWASAAVKAVTALASVVTALALPPMVPVAIGMVRAAKVSEQRRVELEEANAELSEVYTRLKEFDALKTQFFANVSHELRTPLTLILGPTDKLLKSPGVSEAGREELETIRANARALLKHVNDLLDIARMEGGTVRPEYAEVDLAPLVRRVAAQFELLALERRITYRVDVAEPLPAQVDPDQLQRILVNLLSNAFKFTPPGGIVRCSARSEGEELFMEVADSGPGIPEDQRQRVFERFHQASGGATREFGGTGLGLSIVKEFVELHRGSVSADTAPEGGALLRVALPLRAPAGASVGRDENPELTEASQLAADELRSSLRTAPPTAPQPAEARATDPDAPVILVVEDHPDVRRFAADSLSADYRVLEAENGEEGLRLALEQRPDLVLTDLMMPRMSGDELIRQARRHRELDGIPIVVLTARAEEDLRAGLLREGAQDYLMKPFSVEELRARVDNLVQIKRTRELLQVEVESQVTDLEALTRDLRHHRRELEGTVESLRVALEQAEQASQVKTNFLGLVSHELRTPLTTLQLQLQMLQRDREGTLTQKQRETVRKMGLATNRLIELVESLLEYSRIKSGRLEVRKEELDLAELAGSSVEELRQHAESRGLELRLAPETAERLEVISDPRLLRLALVNLIVNAVKFTEEGWVEVCTGYLEGRPMLQVQDTGPGIPLDRQSHIFEPFEQLETMAHKHKPGVGLGLALVKEMVDALEGEIQVRSGPEGGSTFRILLGPD